MKNHPILYAFYLLLMMQSLWGVAQEQPAPQSGFRSGHPADDLPPYIRKVSGFGERPEWSHDGKYILFVDKPMGEVYELELSTGIISPKTRHFNHFGFTRAIYLSNGDILLAGPNEPFDPTNREERNRARDLCWLSVLDKSGNKKPVPLNVVCAEGPAVSRDKLRLAWTERDRQNPDLGKNHARHFMAELVYDNGVPRLENKRVVFDSHQLPFHLGNSSLETQNLVPPNDTKLIFSVYQMEDGNNTDTYIVDTATGEFQNLTRSPAYYDEPEGIFPDGLHTSVEHGPSQHTAWPMIDIFKLKLDGSGEMQRLTYFSDFKGFKASQGVVSDDGKFLCFQIGKSGDEAGVGYGFFVMDLETAAPHLEPFKSFAEGIHPLQAVANEFETAWNKEQPLPAITQLKKDITLEQAYDVQRAWVYATLEENGIGGVKGGMVTPGSQQRFKINTPVGGILRAAGRIEAADPTVVRQKDFQNLSIETEIGFVVGTRIDKKLTSLDEFKDHISGIVPVVELPAGVWDQPEGPPNPADYAATNIRSVAYIVGAAKGPEQIDPKTIQLSLTRNGTQLHEATGEECWEGPWETGLWLAQFAHRQGITLEPGQVLICGALGQVHPGEKGKYVYDAGALGVIRFTIK